MKIPCTKILGVMAVLVSSQVAFAADDDTVASPVKRQETLDKAKALVATHEIVALAVDPFHPEAFAEVVAGSRGLGVTTTTTSGGGGDPTPHTPTGPRNDHDLVAAIAASLKPSGFFVLGGQPTLVFGQKRVKAGSTLTITFEGNEYTLEITKVDRTNFTLRLNREEFTRPNK